MNIERLSSYGNDGVVNRTQGASDAKRHEDSVNRTTKPKADELTLSQTAKDLQAATSAVEGSSDVREDKIAAIKARLLNGTYKVSDEDLARALARHMMGDISSQ